MTTRWEIVAVQGLRRVALGFSARKTLAALEDATWDGVDKITATFPTPDAAMVERGRGKIMVGTACVVRFSGRTEREVAQDG